MGGTMICRVWTRMTSVLAAGVSVAALSAPLMAAELPEIKVSEANTVPACVTPGRLTAFLEQRNPSLDSKFANIAADYARTGDELKLRWDIAFFQMLLETGNLKFTGDVSSKQNNFAGLGATGRKEPGESFPDVETGVKAHLQHLLLYAGEHLDNPVADRTRKVQEWGVLTSWQKTLNGHITFSQLASKWAPGSRNYARDISGIAADFMDGPCRGEDPKPEMMALWKPDAIVGGDAAKKTDAAYTPPKVSGYDLARKANEDARANGSYIRSSLGAGMLHAIGSKDAANDATDTPSEAPQVKILNATTEDAANAPAETATSDGKAATVQTASLATGAKGLQDAAAAADKSKCKVWTASYGGTRAVIIRAKSEGQDNYTVLDVNEKTAERETDAYIAAYAKGGEKIGDFTTPTQALDKAFEMCPEG